MVFLGLNISESLVTRGSGTSTTAVWTSKRPAEAVVGVSPRVNALKIVVFPDWSNPIIPSFILSFCVERVGNRFTSNSKSKVLVIAERGDFARFLNPSTNFSRMLEYRAQIRLFVAYSRMVGGSSRPIVN